MKRKYKEETIPQRIRVKKARILWDCLFPACQGLKLGMNRHPLFFFSYESALKGITSFTAYSGDIS